MEWLHCNMCARMPSKGAPNRYFLSNCRHVFCQRCSAAMGQPGQTTLKCRICHAQPIKIIPIGNKMNPQAQELFQNYLELVSGACKANTFQTSQTKLVVTRLEKSVIECKDNAIPALQQQIHDLKVQLHGVGKERDTLREEVKRLQGCIQAERQQRLKSPTMQERGDQDDHGFVGTTRQRENPEPQLKGRVRSNYNVLDLLSGGNKKPVSPTFKALPAMPASKPGRGGALGGQPKPPPLKGVIEGHAKRKSPVFNTFQDRFGLAKQASSNPKPMLGVPLVTPYRKHVTEGRNLPMNPARPTSHNDTFQFPF